MKALTLSVPWGYCVARLGKPWENRGWLPGADQLAIGERFAVHNGRSSDVDAIVALRAQGFDVPHAHVMHTPGVVATAVYVGAVRVTHGRGGFNTYDIVRGAAARIDALLDRQGPWLVGPYGWGLEDVIALDAPIPCRGAQGLWTLPGEVAALVAVELARKQHGKAARA